MKLKEKKAKSSLDLKVQYKYVINHPIQKGIKLSVIDDKSESLSILHSQDEEGPKPYVKIEHKIKVKLSEKRKTILINRIGKVIGGEKEEESISNLLNEKLSASKNTIQQLFNARLWRMGGGTAPSRTTNNYNIKWRIDNSRWGKVFWMDNELIPRVYAYTNFETAEEAVSELTQAYKSAEPLAHNILSESLRNYYSQPRSSFLLACVGLEVGIKHACQIQSSPLNYFVNNVPSPPVVQIFRDYFPLKFHCTINKKVLEELKAIVQIRNRLAHQGEITITKKRVLDSIELIKKLLYMIDYLNGHKWAKEYYPKKWLKKT